VVGGNQRVAHIAVTIHRRPIRVTERGIVLDHGLGGLHTPAGLDPADPDDSQGAGQPVRRRKGGAVVEQRRNLGDNRNLEVTAGLDINW